MIMGLRLVPIVMSILLRGKVLFLRIQPTGGLWQRDSRERKEMTVYQVKTDCQERVTTLG